MNPRIRSGASFRDPAGFVFLEGGVLKRAVTDAGVSDYQLLMGSGLYEALTVSSKLVRHHAEENPSPYRAVLVPEPVGVISYPYEWCFSQLRDAAVLTLDVQIEAIRSGLSLKDATPFNVQFVSGRPLFIDTLSFEKYEERPWVGYRQFCEMFLAPLLLMRDVEPDFNRFLAVDLGGIRLGLASRLLPARTRFSPGCLLHIHLHAASQSRYEGRGRTAAGAQSAKMPRAALVALLEGLRAFTASLKPGRARTAFGEYYDGLTHYSDEAERFKLRTVEEWGMAQEPRRVLDLGGNTGKYSRLFTRHAVEALCVDGDPVAVEENYRLSRAESDGRMLPLRLDLSNPSTDLGWNGRERDSFFKRAKPDLVLALALVHHLRIGGNVPVAELSDFFAGLAEHVIVEFVPKEDPKVKQLLSARQDVFDDYNIDAFEKELSRRFTVEAKAPIPSSARTLYLLHRRND